MVLYFDYESLNTGKQPCTNYRYNPIDISIRADDEPQPHCCPVCQSDDLCRYNCGNCGYDHHEGGWENCVKKEQNHEP